jgi:hypothetical protein
MTLKPAKRQKVCRFKIDPGGMRLAIFKGGKITLRSMVLFE